MTPAHPCRRPRSLRDAFALAALAVLSGCNFGEPTAGGSSEVDNPVVALVNEGGARVNVTGSLGIYLSTQSPAVNPASVLELQLTGVDSVVLSAKTLTEALAAAGYSDSTRSLNLYLQAGDSSGAFLQNLVYDPAKGTFSREDTPKIRLLKMTVAPLVSVESVIRGGGETGGVNRVIIPGSPFKTVLMDSVFVFENIPPGVFPIHLLLPDGTEIPLPESLDTDAPRAHDFDPTAPPVVRPVEPPPPSFTVNAGADRTVYAGTQASLSAEVSGVNPGDPRLTVLWRQLPPTNPGGDIATIERPTQLNTKVSFPSLETYTFILTAVIGTRQVTDTVTIGVEPAPPHPVFYNPNAWDTSAFVWAGFQYPFMIRWFAHADAPDTMDILFSRDSGATWQTLRQNSPTVPGFNERSWWPDSADITDEGLLRLVDRHGDTVATSRVFSVIPWTEEDSGGDPASWWKPDSE